MKTEHESRTGDDSHEGVRASRGCAASVFKEAILVWIARTAIGFGGDIHVAVSPVAGSAREVRQKGTRVI